MSENNHRVSLRVIAVFALAARASAARDGFNSDNYGYGGAYGPWGLKSSIFESHLDHANATSDYLLQGKNISEPWPGTGPLDGWSWSISVADDLPANDSTDPNASYFTGSRITFNAPQTLPRLNSSHNISVDRTWQMCLIRWDIADVYDDKLRTDDGSCSTVLSSECARDIEAGVVKNYTQNAGCQCPDVGNLSSCKGVDVLIRNSCEARTFNSSAIELWPDGRYELFAYGGDPHVKGNTSAYNETGSIAWPLMVMWGGSIYSSGIANDTAKLSCVRAKNATAGSVVPGWSGTSSVYGYLHSQTIYMATAVSGLVTLWTVWT